MNDGPLLLSPTFPPPVPMGGGFGGFDNRVRKNLLRKTVDYQASTLRYLESRIWQRDKRDTPVLQPDSAYFNDLLLPVGMKNQPVNAVTTKFVRASTNKQRSPIFCTSWLPDGRRLATGAASGEFTLWNGVNFNYESILQAHDGPIRSMKWSHNGEWMVTTDDRGFVKYWQSNFNNVHTFQAHNEPIRCSSFSPNDSKLATCSDDGTVRIFDFMSCSVEWLLRGHGADVKCCDWHPRKSLLVSGSKDNQQPVKVWDCRSGQSVTTIHAHKATVQSVSWNKNGNWLLTASRDSLIKIYDIRAMKELCVLKGHKKEVNTVAWHPIHESLFASGGSDGAILFWLVGNDREVGGMESAHEGFIWSLSWHPLGHILCSGSNDHTSKFWCRNRPGEELKDKYNTFNNPFGVEEMESSSYQFPGMGTGMRGNSTAITLPPPSSRLANHAVTLPPPNWQHDPLFPKKNSFDGQANPGAPPRVDVPVLGADIIKETFSDTAKPPQVGVENGNKPKLFGGEDQFNPPAPRPPPHFPHQHNGPIPPHMNEFDYPRGPHPRPPGRPPMPPDFIGDRTVRHGDHLPPPPGFHPEMRDPRMRDWRPPGPFGPRGPPPRGNFRYPPDDFEERGRPFGNRFSWHRHDYPGRRPSFDEEDWGGPYEMGGNPYSYRRPPPPHEGFRERQDPRMMGEHPGPMERDEHQIHGPPHPVPPHSQKGPPPPQQVAPSDDSRIEPPGRPHERFDNHPDHYSQPPSHVQEGRAHSAPHPPPASSSTLQMPEQNQQGPPQHPRDPRDPRRSRTLPEIPPSQATQGHPPQGMPPQALIPPSHPPQAHHHSSAQDNVPPQNVNEKHQNNFPSPVGPPPSQPLFLPHSQHQFHHPSHQGAPVMSGPPSNRPQFPGQDQQGKEQQGPPPLFQGQDQRRNFPPDQQGPPRRDFPPDQQGPPRRDFPPDQQGPPRRDFPPDQQGPPRRDFPPDQQGPPRRDFPPDQQGPPRRDFLPDQQGPPRRDFPPDQQGPPRRDFPPDQQGPPRRDFPPDQQGPPRRDFPPDQQGPPRRDFPPDQQGPPRRDFPPDQGPPRRDFPPDQLPPESRYSSDPRGPPDQQRHGDPRIYRGPPPIEQRPYPPNEQGYAFSRGPPPTNEQRYPPNQQGYRGPLPPGNDQRYPPDPMQERQQQPPAHLPPGHRDQFGRFDGAQGPQQQQVHGPGSHYERHFPEQQHSTYSSNEPSQPPGPGYPGGDPRYEHWTASGGPPSRSAGRPYPEQRWGGRRDSPQWNQREQHQDGDPRERRGENNWGDRSEGEKKDREERERRKPRDKEVSRRAPSGTEHRNTSSSRRKSDSDNKDNPPAKRNRKDSGERDKDKGKEMKEKDKGKARSKSKK